MYKNQREKIEAVAPIVGQAIHFKEVNGKKKVYLEGDFNMVDLEEVMIVYKRWEGQDESN